MKVRALQRSLLVWYETHGRALPWRNVQDVYKVWVSEIMLQQTQVKTVLPYYERWLQLFPTVESLATADLQSVLKAWEGLGYYARARNFHKAAQTVVQDFSGDFPRTLDDTTSLSGIGRTTAGGILSSAFNLPVPILDGNVKRVLARLIKLPVPPAKALKQLWALSELLVKCDRPRDFNQALMDLGATVCTRYNPACLLCPWQKHCQAYQSNMQNELPVTTPSAPLPHKQIGVAVIFNDQDKILIDKRKPEGLLGGLWEFPGGKIEAEETAKDCIVREIEEELAIAITVQDHLVTVEHAYTHFKVTLIVYRCRYLSGEPQPLACDEIRWVTLAEIGDYPFPKANQQIIAVLKQEN
ncbi:MAG: A/G-specific adenine glycosylase [Cyanobacteria bacterium P01_H01_bin.15]